MTIWIDAHLSPAIAPWISRTFIISTFALRDLGLRFVDMPIISLKALAMTGDREKCLAVGANEYLSKPIKLKALADSIRSILGNWK